MPPPFFSILLPTKNRAIILAEAIQSILDQTFPDFELVVSDNDDSDVATRAVVATFSDARLRYHRTSGKLPMHENWENALRLATGRHVFVLEDKARLVPNALEVLHGILAREPDAVISFPFVLAEQDELPPVAVSPVPRRIPSEEILARLCDFDESVFPLLPRGLNSSAPRALFEALRQISPTGQLFSYVAPDFAQCYQVLSRVSEILALPQGLVYAPLSLKKKGSFSNGGACLRKDDGARRWLAELPVSVEALTAHVPVKSPWLWLNILIHDFHVFVCRPGFVPRWNWVKYHSFCLYLIVLGMMWGGEMGPERTAVAASLRREGLGFSFRVGLDFLRRCARAAWGRLKGNREV